MNANPGAESVNIEHAFVGYQLAPQKRVGTLGPMFVADYFLKRKTKSGRTVGSLGRWGALSLTAPEQGIQPFTFLNSEQTDW